MGWGGFQSWFAYDAWGARVGEDVRVALHDLVRGEWPQPLRRPSVVVVDERDGSLRHPPNRTGRLAVAAAVELSLSLSGASESGPEWG